MGGLAEFLGLGDIKQVVGGGSIFDENVGANAQLDKILAAPINQGQQVAVAPTQQAFVKPATTGLGTVEVNPLTSGVTGTNISEAALNQARIEQAARQAAFKAKQDAIAARLAAQQQGQ